MTKLPDGQVWLARDTNSGILPKRPWCERQELVKIHDHQPIPTGLEYRPPIAWAQFGMVGDIGINACENLFGVIPEQGEAIHIDITNRDWWCPDCCEWYREVYLANWEARSESECECSHHVPPVSCTKSRAHVIEPRIILEDVK